MVLPWLSIRQALRSVLHLQHGIETVAAIWFKQDPALLLREGFRFERVARGCRPGGTSARIDYVYPLTW
jgi:hypothetical protein